MANSYMVLRNKRTGTEVGLARYYPSTGWYYRGSPESIGIRLQAAFDEADWGSLSREEREANATKVGFGPPYAASAEVDGEEWEIVYK